MTYSFTAANQFHQPSPMPKAEAKTRPWELHIGDCVDVMRKLPADHFHAIVCDPPYGIGFMGKEWDTYKGTEGLKQFQGWCELWAREALRVLRPGGHLLSFGGTRTYHRMAVGIEDAGFEIRDCVMWIYGIGLPKAAELGRQIDGHVGAAPARMSHSETVRLHKGIYGRKTVVDKRKPVSEEGKKWYGWRTLLRPAWEPCVVARKPLSEKTVVENVLRWGTGALNIRECRIKRNGEGVLSDLEQAIQDAQNDTAERDIGGAPRWPGNVMHDGSEEVLALFPKDHLGTTARFFWSPKATKQDRNMGHKPGEVNAHPTVKPTDVMKYFVRMTTPRGGLVLDPFAGSGSTGVGAILEGSQVTLIEKTKEYTNTIRRRCSAAVKMRDRSLGFFKESRAVEAKAELDRPRMRRML